MPAESTIYRWLQESDDAETLRAALQRVDLEAEFREFLLEKYAYAREEEGGKSIRENTGLSG
jgi:hypothetical protein